MNSTVLLPSYRLSPFYGFYGGALGYGSLGLYDGFWPGYYGYAGSYAYGSPLAYPGYSGYGYAPYPLDVEGPTGGLRLKIEPRSAEVYVDGYYAGIVDDFDGIFQHLDLPPGPHRIEVRAPGFESLVIDVNIQAHHTTKYQGVLRRQ